MTFTWGGSVFDGEPPSLTPAYLVANIPPGYTLRRTLLWVQSILEYTSPDSLAGTAMLYGLVVGPSNTAPPLTPYTDWGTPGSGTWLWTWAARYKESYPLPGSSPQQYIGYSDLDDKNFSIEVQRKNTSLTATEYLWFVGEVHPGVVGPQVTTSTYTRCLFEHP